MDFFKINIVLVEPEIPQNTGTIGRMCLALQGKLHLVEPMGFQIDNSRLKRAGLDYWEHLDCQIYPNLEALLQVIPPDAQKVFLSKKAGHTIYEHQFKNGCYLFFGKETAGLPEQLLNQYPLDSVRIPMIDARVRSLNLSNSASIVAYEALRQICFQDQALTNLS